MSTFLHIYVSIVVLVSDSDSDSDSVLCCPSSPPPAAPPLYLFVLLLNVQMAGRLPYDTHHNTSVFLFFSLLGLQYTGCVHF